MTEKEPGDRRPSLELPSFRLGRKRGRDRSRDAAQEPASPTPPPAPPEEEPEPERERARGPALVPEPDPERPAEPQSADFPQVRQRRHLVLPRISGMVASVITGAVIGVLTVGATWASLRLCEFVRGTSSCGHPGFFLLLATLIVMVLLGRLLLTAFGVSDPGSTSFLGVGLIAVISLVFLVDLLFAWWMILVIPAVAMASYALSHWVTTTFTEGDAADSMHR